MLPSQAAAAPTIIHLRHPDLQGNIEQIADADFFPGAETISNHGVSNIVLVTASGVNLMKVSFVPLFSVSEVNAERLRHLTRR